MQTSVTGLEDALPLVGPPLSTAFGCFDPLQQATVVLLDPNGHPTFTADTDPVIASIPFTVSAPCGTPTTFDGFVANPGTVSCPDADRAAAETTGPVSLSFPGGTA
jgi:hypothetical protein